MAVTNDPHPVETGPVDPGLYRREDLRVALAGHDIATVYRALLDTGLSQRRIAQLTGQSQSQVCEILKGRRVLVYDVLARIADGLGIPRELMGLSRRGPDQAPDAYAGQVTVANPDQGEQMLRRHFEKLLGLGAAAVVGAPVPGLGDLTDWLTAPSLPTEDRSRIGSGDVAMIRRCGEQVSALARTCGGQGRAAVRLTDWAEQWLTADCAEQVRRELLSTLAHLHTVTAWCCHDSGAVTRSYWHFGRAIELATQAGDSYQATYAMRHAGMMLIDRGEPNNALKLIQLAQLRLDDMPRDDPRGAVPQAECRVISALALSRIHQRDPSSSAHRLALDELRAAREGSTALAPHAQGCMDLDSAHAYLHLGQFDVAEATAARAAQTLTHSGDRREGALADMALARLHVLTGEPRGLTLARSAIDAVTQTRSAIARQCWLPPLVKALEARPGSEARDLARTAHRVTTAV